MKNDFGFVRVAACSPEVKPGDVEFNTGHIISQIQECADKCVDLALFPELSVTGYTCGDLFGQRLIVEQARKALDKIAEAVKDCRNIVAVVGAPVLRFNRLYNCGVVIGSTGIAGIVPKTYVPTYGEFYERRWFTPAGNSPSEYKDSIFDIPDRNPAIFWGTKLIFAKAGFKFGVEICEDLWVPNPPSGQLAMHGADIILNLSATDELIGKHHYIVDLVCNQSARCRCGYVYASAGTGESSTDLAFAGNCIIAENGRLLAESKRFTFDSKIAIADIDIYALRHDRQVYSTYSEGVSKDKYIDVEADGFNAYMDEEVDAICNPAPERNLDPASKDLLAYRRVDPHPFVDDDPAKLEERCNEISSIQAWGLAVRLKAINCQRAVVGISGGLDSTLALLVTVKAFDMLGLDRKGIIGITMPGFGTTKRTHDNASELMDLLGVTHLEIPIAKAVEQHFKDIHHDPTVTDVTYENSQARERTQILMDVANQENAIVIGTGDLSELALGWCTYNGDQMSMYGVNGSIPKTLVKYLVEGYAKETDNPKLSKVLMDIVSTPISPELLPADKNGQIDQKTEDLVGPYELHDFFLYNMLRFGMEPAKIFMLAKKAFSGHYDEQTIKHWLRTFYRRFFSQQFKRSCMPDGVKVGSISLSPRGDWRMPSDASAALWLKQIDSL